jgi:hypothetical protein
MSNETQRLSNAFPLSLASSARLSAACWLSALLVCKAAHQYGTCFMCGTGPFPLCTLQIGYGAKGSLECEPHQECAECRSVVIMAVVIITASVGSARGAARDACHTTSASAGARYEPAPNRYRTPSTFSSAKQCHQSSQYGQLQRLAHLLLPFSLCGVP